MKNIKKVVASGAALALAAGMVFGTTAFAGDISGAGTASATLTANVNIPDDSFTVTVPNNITVNVNNGWDSWDAYGRESAVWSGHAAENHTLSVSGGTVTLTCGGDNPFTVNIMVNSDHIFDNYALSGIDFIDINGIGVGSLAAGTYTGTCTFTVN